MTKQWLIMSGGWPDGSKGDATAVALRTALAAVTGGSLLALLAFRGATLRIIAGTFLNKVRGPMAFDYALLDSAKIDEAKGAAMEEERRLHGDGGVPYVSTNDVLTSWLMTSSTSDVGLMAVNWRGRLGGVTRRHAGNYENVIFYSSPSDCSSPGLIVPPRPEVPEGRRGVVASPAVVEDGVDLGRDELDVVRGEELHRGVRGGVAPAADPAGHRAVPPLPDVRRVQGWGRQGRALLPAGRAGGRGAGPLRLEVAEAGTMPCFVSLRTHNIEFFQLSGVGNKRFSSTKLVYYSIWKS